MGKLKKIDISWKSEKFKAKFCSVFEKKRFYKKYTENVWIWKKRQILSNSPTNFHFPTNKTSLKPNLNINDFYFQNLCFYFNYYY